MRVGESHVTTLNSRSCVVRFCTTQLTLSRPTFWHKVVTMSSSSTVEQDPGPSLDDQDESVRIAVKALGDMRNSRPLPSSSKSIRVYNLPQSLSKTTVSASAYHVQKSPFPRRSSSRHHLQLPRYLQPTRPTMPIQSILSRVYRQYLLSTLLYGLMNKRKRAQGWSKYVFLHVSHLLSFLPHPTLFHLIFAFSMVQK